MIFVFSTRRSLSAPSRSNVTYITRTLVETTARIEIAAIEECRETILQRANVLRDYSNL